MSFEEFYSKIEKELFDFLEYLEANNLELDDNGDIVEKGTSRKLMREYYKDDDE